MTDITAGGGAPPGRLQIQFSIHHDKPAPPGRALWEVYARRWLVIEECLGSVIATGKDEAMANARGKWPHEKHIRVYPA